jgi:hypothetical protein
MNKFEEMFSEVVPFHEFDGGHIMGYAISANSWSKEEARKLFEEYTSNAYINIDVIEKDYVRFGLCNTDCGTISGWMQCQNKKGAQPIWWLEE